MGRDSDRVFRFLREICQAHVSVCREELGEEKSSRSRSRECKEQALEGAGGRTRADPLAFEKSKTEGTNLGLGLKC